MSVALSRLCESQGLVYALCQAHKTEHADHIVLFLADQAFPVEEVIFIIMALVHDKTAAAVDGVADGCHSVRDDTV